MNHVTAQRPAEPVRACDIEPGTMIHRLGRTWMLLHDFNLAQRRFDQDHKFIDLTNGNMLITGAGSLVEPLYPGSVVTIAVESVLAKVPA